MYDNPEIWIKGVWINEVLLYCGNKLNIESQLQNKKMSCANCQTKTLNVKIIRVLNNSYYSKVKPKVNQMTVREMLQIWSEKSGKSNSECQCGPWKCNVEFHVWYKATHKRNICTLSSITSCQILLHLLHRLTEAFTALNVASRIKSTVVQVVLFLSEIQLSKYPCK